MFGTCLWFRYVGWLPDINLIIRNIAQQLKSFSFPAHITIRSNVAQTEIHSIVPYYRSIPKPFFTVGKLKQTVTVGSHGNKFYALQRDLYLNGSTFQVSTYHMSLAYRINKEFSSQEMTYVDTMTKNIHKINGTDLSIELWNCQHLHPTKWQPL